jgi:hypothetical protein
MTYNPEQTRIVAVRKQGPSPVPEHEKLRHMMIQVFTQEDYVDSLRRQIDDLDNATARSLVQKLLPGSEKRLAMLKEKLKEMDENI